MTTVQYVYIDERVGDHVRVLLYTKEQPRYSACIWTIAKLAKILGKKMTPRRVASIAEGRYFRVSREGPRRKGSSFFAGSTGNAEVRDVTSQERSKIAEKEKRLLSRTRHTHRPS